MKEKIAIQIIREKTEQATPAKVHQYPYPNATDCIKAIIHIAAIACKRKKQKGAILIVKT